MTTTSHEDQEPREDDLESTSKPEAQSQDDQRVPKGEHIEQRQKLRAAKDEISALRDELAEVKKRLSGDKPTQEPRDDLAATVRELQRNDRLREIRTELGLQNDAAKKVLDIVSAMPDLSIHEARTIAAAREPALFETDGSADGFHPGTHGVARPGSGIPPAPQEQPLDTKDRLAHIKSLTGVDKKQSRKYLDNLVGSIAAAQVGKPGHKRLPLPRSDQ